MGCREREKGEKEKRRGKEERTKEINVLLNVKVQKGYTTVKTKNCLPFKKYLVLSLMCF